MPSQALIDAMMGKQTPGVVGEEENFRQMQARDPANAAAIGLMGSGQRKPAPYENMRLLASMLPVIGNVMAAKDAYDNAGQVVEASKTGDVRGQRKAAAMTGLSLLGAMSPLPWGGAARRAAEGATSRANIFAGPMAKTADHAALAKAQELAASGTPREAIWNQTGWFQGKDGQWRFEIDDTGAKVNFGQGAGVSEGPIQHDLAAAAYPGLQDMKTSVLPDAPGDWTSYYVRRGNGGPELRVRGRDPDDRRLPARSTAIHELQHAVDDQEGLLTGYGPYKSPAEAYSAMPELTAREAQWRMEMAAAERRGNLPRRLTQDIPDEQQIVRSGLINSMSK